MPSPSYVVTGLADTIEALRALPGRIGSSKIRPAIERACAPAIDALRANTPKGPTGNLLRAAAIKSVSYSSGTVVVIVGYIRSGTAKTGNTGGKYRTGPDRAFHQHWIEEGTAPRRLVKSVIASSLNTTGGYGAAYFKSRGFNARALTLGPSDSAGASTVTQVDGIVVFRPKGGVIRPVTAQHPMKRAFLETADLVEQRMRAALEEALVRAVEESRRN